VKSEFYIHIVERTLEGILVILQFQEKRSWFLLRDSAPARSAMIVKRLLVSRGITEIAIRVVRTSL
jgi:hypothetical protein